MKRILVCLTLALCLVSLFSLTAFGAQIVSFSADIPVSIATPDLFTEGNYVVEFNIDGVNYGYYEFNLTNLSLDGWVNVNYNFNYNNTEYAVCLDFYPDAMECLVYDCNGMGLPAGSIGVVSTVEDVSLDDPESVSPVAGIFGVFTGVGSWFAGQLGTASSLFWNGHSLTFIGVLSIAGLALAVVLLLVFVIVRFLRFRG